MTPAERAVAHVDALALAATPAARRRVAAALRQTPAAGADADMLGAGLFRRGRVAVHFHPDRIAAGGLTTVAALLTSGTYLSQFVTGVSAGGLTAHPGGDRDRWEDALFGGAYHRPAAPPSQRPVYGALDLLGHADGPAPRFGSCRLRLREHVLARTTLSVGDTVTQPADRGTRARPLPLVAGLLEGVADGTLHLGAPELAAADMAGLLLSASGPVAGTTRLGRAMDSYLEAQVHGGLDIARDADELEADPSFAGTAVGADLEALAARCGLTLRWHPGFVLPADAVPAGPRGPVMPVLARRLRALTGEDVVTAAVIGAGARSLVLEPAAWADLGSPAECLQWLKQLWHVLVLAGAPA